MSLLERFNSLVQALQTTTKRIEKENILKEYVDDEEVKSILQFIYDPYILSGIRSKSLAEASYIPYYESEDLLEVLDRLKTHNTGRKIDVEFAKGFVIEAAPYSDLAASIICKDLKLGVQPTTSIKILPI